MFWCTIFLKLILYAFCKQISLHILYWKTVGINVFQSVSIIPGIYHFRWLRFASEYDGVIERTLHTRIFRSITLLRPVLGNGQCFWISELRLLYWQALRISKFLYCLPSKFTSHVYFKNKTGAQKKIVFIVFILSVLYA